MVQANQKMLMLVVLLLGTLRECDRAPACLDEYMSWCVFVCVRVETIRVAHMPLQDRQFPCAIRVRLLHIAVQLSKAARQMCVCMCLCMHTMNQRACMYGT